MREGKTAKSVSESTVALMWCFFRPDIDGLRLCYVSMKKKNYVRTRRPVFCRMLRGAMVRFWRAHVPIQGIGTKYICAHMYLYTFRFLDSQSRIRFTRVLTRSLTRILKTSAPRLLYWDNYWIVAAGSSVVGCGGS